MSINLESRNKFVNKIKTKFTKLSESLKLLNSIDKQLLLSQKGGNKMFETNANITSSYHQIAKAIERMNEVHGNFKDVEKLFNKALTDINQRVNDSTASILNIIDNIEDNTISFKYFTDEQNKLLNYHIDNISNVKDDKTKYNIYDEIDMRMPSDDLTDKNLVDNLKYKYLICYAVKHIIGEHDWAAKIEPRSSDVLYKDSLTEALGTIALPDKDTYIKHINQTTTEIDKMYTYKSKSPAGTPAAAAASPAGPPGPPAGPPAAAASPAGPPGPPAGPPAAAASPAAAAPA